MKDQMLHVSSKVDGSVEIPYLEFQCLLAISQQVCNKDCYL